MKITHQDTPFTENTSGTGKLAVLPAELEGWSWGAFLLNWIWGIGNSVYIALLMFIPIVNLVMPFVLGAKGNKWAWANRSWRDAAHFRQVQCKWTWAGLIIIVLFLAISAGVVMGISSILSNSQVQTMALEQARENPEVVAALGEPMKTGWFTSGQIKVTDHEGTASLSIPLFGPKGEGTLYVSAIRSAGKWRIVRLVLEIAQSGLRINLLEVI